MNLNSLPWRIGPIRSGPLKSADPIPAYLVLLRVGFTMRQPLLTVRCALTAPFHPYRRFLTESPAVCFLLHWPSSRLEAAVPDVIRHTALRSPDFPPPDCGFRRARQRSSSRLRLKCSSLRANHRVHRETERAQRKGERVAHLFLSGLCAIRFADSDFSRRQGSKSAQFDSTRGRCRGGRGWGRGGRGWGRGGRG